MDKFRLPTVVSDLVAARNALREQYKKFGLKFTLDGNLVGDLGEVIAAELFCVELDPDRSKTGIDGYAPDGRTVQIKTTGTGRGPAFRLVDTRADHFIFLDLDFDAMMGVVVFNGPEAIATALLPKQFSGQRSITRKKIQNANTTVNSNDRLPIVNVN